MQAEASQQQITSVTGVKFDELFNFAGCDVDSDGVVHLDQRIWVADTATVTSDNTWDAFQSNQHLLHFAQLVLNEPQSQHQIMYKALSYNRRISALIHRLRMGSYNLATGHYH